VAPDPARSKICAERERLSRVVLDAVGELMALQAEQSSDLISGGDGLPRIDLAITAARRNWEKARDNYVAHVQAHGC